MYFGLILSSFGVKTLPSEAVTCDTKLDTVGRASSRAVVKLDVQRSMSCRGEALRRLVDVQCSPLSVLVTCHSLLVTLKWLDPDR